MRGSDDAGGPTASLLITHADGSEIFPLSEGRGFVVGREVPSDVCVRDPELSAQHARVEVSSSELWVEDLGSESGTRVNGRRIERVQLRLDDEITLGSVRVTVRALSGPRTQSRTLATHEALTALLEAEITRARHFGRNVALVSIRASGPGAGWIDRAQAGLRPVDCAALYSSNTLEILLPETGREAAFVFANAIIEGRAAGEPELVAGIAVFPDSATTADELRAVSTSATRQASALRAIVSSDSSSARVVREGAQLSVDEDAPVMESAAMRALKATIVRVSRAAIPVLLSGETGAGKEVVAKMIHDLSPRAGGRLVCVNCGAIPATLLESTLFGHEKGAFTGATQRHAGVFESADGGTVFLDEVGELPPAAQATLLRVLETKRITPVGASEERAVDVRVLTATHRDLAAMSDAGTFRLDLYYRLNVFTLKLPPLRDRPEDITPLVDRFVALGNEANDRQLRGLTPEALELVFQHRWPGNVRELKNVIDRAVVIAQGEWITRDDLPEELRIERSDGAEARSEAEAASPTGDVEAGSLKDRVRRLEVRLITEALETTGGNQTEAARLLEMPLRTLVSKIKSYGIQRRG